MTAVYVAELRDELVAAGGELLAELADDGITPGGMEQGWSAVDAYTAWRDGAAYSAAEHGTVYVLAQALLIFLREVDGPDGVSSDAAVRLREAVRAGGGAK